MSRLILSSISAEDAQDAFSAAYRDLANAKTQAALLRRLLGSPLIGAYCTARLAPRIEALFPDFHVRYSSFNGTRTVYFAAPASDDTPGPRPVWRIQLATSKNPRISRESLQRALYQEEKRIATLTEELCGFWDALSQWNNLAPCMHALYDRLWPVMCKSHTLGW